MVKVFRAHAAPQGLGGNLINALKLLANQQEDGDGSTQNIVTNFGEVSREELTNGLNRALEVGYLSGSFGVFQSTKTERIRRIPRVDGQGEPR